MISIIDRKSLVALLLFIYSFIEQAFIGASIYTTSLLRDSEMLWENDKNSRLLERQTQPRAQEKLTWQLLVNRNPVSLKLSVHFAGRW